MSLRQSVISGVFWRSGGRIVNQVVQLGISIVLARLLTPEDYGIVAMATVFLTFAGIFCEFGLSAALVQRQDITSGHMDSVFWANLAVGVAIAALLWLVAPWVAGFYGEPILADVFPVLALSFAMAPLGVVQRALLTREMAFRALAGVEIGTTLATGMLAIALALNGLGVWSLVWSAVLGKIVTYVFLNLFSQWRPGRRFDFRALKDLLSFGANLTAHNFVSFVAGSADRLIIGKVMGAHSVGIYGRAHALMLAPFTQIVWALTFVLFPALSSIQDNKPRVRDIYLRSLTVTFFVSAPLLVGLAVVAEIFVPVVFGSQWLDAVPILQLFCALGLLQVVTHLLGPVIESQGRPGLMVKLGMFQTALILVGISAGVSLNSLELAALGVVTANALCFYPWMKYGGELVGLKLLDIWDAVCVSLACALVMGGVVWMARVSVLREPTLMTLLLCICLGVAAYGLMALSLKPRGWLELETVIRGFAQRKPSRS